MSEVDQLNPDILNAQVAELEFAHHHEHEAGHVHSADCGHFHAEVLVDRPDGLSAHEMGDHSQCHHEHAAEHVDQHVHDENCGHLHHHEAAHEVDHGHDHHNHKKETEAHDKDPHRHKEVVEADKITDIVTTEAIPERILREIANEEATRKVDARKTESSSDPKKEQKTKVQATETAVSVKPNTKSAPTTSRQPIIPKKKKEPVAEVVLESNQYQVVDTLSTKKEPEAIERATVLVEDLIEDVTSPEAIEVVDTIAETTLSDIDATQPIEEAVLKISHEELPDVFQADITSEYVETVDLSDDDLPGVSEGIDIIATELAHGSTQVEVTEGQLPDQKQTDTKIEMLDVVITEAVAKITVTLLEKYEALVGEITEEQAQIKTELEKVFKNIVEATKTKEIETEASTEQLKNLTHLLRLLGFENPDETIKAYLAKYGNGFIEELLIKFSEILNVDSYKESLVQNKMKLSTKITNAHVSLGRIILSLLGLDPELYLAKP